MTSPNCLCKLKHFTFYLRDLVLERAEWKDEQKSTWPILHDLIAITAMCCLKNEGFKLFKNNNAFGLVKYDNEVYLREFRSPDGKLLITSRLNGFTKFIIVFLVTCVDGEVQLIGRVHNSDDEELSFYEMKAEAKVASSIHFALCGGYFKGQPVYLQYDIPRLLKSIYEAIEPVKEYVTQNWQYDGIMQYLQHLPLFLMETIFGDKEKSYLRELHETNAEAKYKDRHTNPENLMFLSPEMNEAQVKAELVLYHYRENEKLIINARSKKQTEAESDSKITFFKGNTRKKPLITAMASAEKLEITIPTESSIQINLKQLQNNENVLGEIQFLNGNNIIKPSILSVDTSIQANFIKVEDLILQDNMDKTNKTSVPSLN